MLLRARPYGLTLRNTPERVETLIETGPKNRGRSDLAADTITHLSETSYRDGPFVAPDDGTVYFCRDLSIFKRNPEPGGEVVLVNTIPDEVHRGRPCGRMVSHLTRSADGKEFFIDAHFGDEYVAVRPNRFFNSTTSMAMSGGMLTAVDLF